MSSSSTLLAARRRSAARQAADAAGRCHRRRGRAGRPSTATRCAPSSPNTVRSWFAVSGCATRPRPRRCSGGWPRGLMTEKEAFAPRQTYAEGVYSSSKWPPNQPMCMHHELSYRSSSPASCCSRACLRPPRAGRPRWPTRRPCSTRCPPSWSSGSSGRAGCSSATTTTRSARRSPTRSAPTTVAPSRATAVPTRSSSSGSPTAACAPGSAAAPWCAHPLTGQRCWFNQIAFLNEWTMDPEVREYLVDTYGEDGLPFNTRFGNGDPIGEDVVQLINEVYEATHRARAVAGRRPDARRQRPHRAQQGALRGTARSVRRDGRPGAPGRLLADHRGDRRMTTSLVRPVRGHLRGSDVYSADVSTAHRPG